MNIIIDINRSMQVGRSCLSRMVVLVTLGWTGVVAGEENPPPFIRSGPVAKPNCVSCHAWLDTVTRPRPLTAPHNLMPFAHGKGELWCLDCHASEAREKLRAGGETLVEWDAADRSCALCHGRHVAKWQVGVHGKRIGSWFGPRTILRCQTCHDAHQPAWQPVVPDPPPPRFREGMV
ncbi:MAG: hypothetical protein H7833_12625 [Magnetococcus sp. DMHC-1]|nr:hypothetical protein [Magnetococcales bacterium]